MPRRRHPILPLLAFTAVCASLIWLTLDLLDMRPHRIHWFSLGYFFVLSLLLHLWQEAAMAGDPGGFMRRYIAGLVIKLLLSIAVITMLMVLIPRQDALPVVGVFAMLYLAYLAFSTVRMVGISRRMGK